ncbi:hypothetical protein [Haladaptatus sp. NG-WS-4]
MASAGNGVTLAPATPPARILVRQTRVLSVVWVGDRRWRRCRVRDGYSTRVSARHLAGDRNVVKLSLSPSELDYDAVFGT